VIKKPRGQGGHSPRWAAEPEKTNRKGKELKCNKTIKWKIVFIKGRNPENDQKPYRKIRLKVENSFY
jgi:hypothetical protein